MLSLQLNMLMFTSKYKANLCGPNLSDESMGIPVYF